MSALDELADDLHGRRAAAAPLALPRERAFIRNGREHLKPLSTKWRTILTLELRGRTKLEIAQQLGRSYGSIVNITNTVRYREYRDEMLLHVDEEFLNLKPMAYNALRCGLGSPDERTASQNARWYFETLGYGKSERANEGATAEEIVGLIFKRAQITLEQHAHLHVGEESDEIVHDNSPTPRTGSLDEVGRDVGPHRQQSHRPQGRLP